MDNLTNISITNSTATELSTLVPELANRELFYGRHEFITEKPGLAIPSLIVLVIATITGTFGNILTLVVIASRRSTRKAESIFIVNLAISDLYVTTLADPMSIIAKVEGEEFFDRIPGLCQAIASMCTISCVTSLMTIGLMSVNRYIYICVNEHYERIFTNRKCICMCVSVYFVGGLLVSLNGAKIGDHGYDRKSIECIWDRMATYPYTVVFSIALVWIPSIVIGACYLKIFLYVRAHKTRMRQQSSYGKKTSLKSFQLARTLFIIYAVFITCWAPYALLIVIDTDDTFPFESHLFITVFAHLHPSINWIIYYFTNKKFAASYREVLKRCKLCPVWFDQSTISNQRRNVQRGKDDSSYNASTTEHAKNKDIALKDLGTQDSGIVLSSQATTC